MLTKIKKRDGSIVDFDKSKIENAIFKAADAVGMPNRELAKKLTEQVVAILSKQYDDENIPNVENVQDIVEEVLIKNGQAKIAKAYILYRQKRTEIREIKKRLGVKDDMKNLSINAIRVLKERYLIKDEEGNVIESPKEMFRRVAHDISLAELNYNKSEENRKYWEDKFFKIMTNLEFIPNSPTLMNAGTPLQQLAACFVLPVPDNIEGIFDAIKYTAMIHKSGGGTGFSFSSIRPCGDVVRSTYGVASGPISFMKIFNITTEVIKQGGRRRGANMGVLRVDHPDIVSFITAKEREGELNNFNISVAITEEFMRKVELNQDYDLINPRTNKPCGKLNARKIFDLISLMAWKNGEPGILFIDRINKDNPTPKIGKIESTNPCGEQPLLPYESCNLGSINLSMMVTERDNGSYEIDWAKLKETVKIAVRFLDNVIDRSKYPIQQIADMVRANRKIGLGVMGWADMLIKLAIPYNSLEAIELAKKVMRTIQETAIETSIELAKERGAFPNFRNSVFYDRGEPERRNATLTTIAPTGTISIIAGCSSGIEPLFAISFVRNVLGGQRLIEVNPLFEAIAQKKGFYSAELMEKIAEQGSIQHLDEIPDDIKKIFVTAHDIEPEWHVRMQAAFQQYVDNAVSKTINFPHDAKVEDIQKAYWLAYKLGCKGITVYRDRSREEQVIEFTIKKKKGQKKESEDEHKLSSGKEAPWRIENGKLVVDEDYAGGCPTCHI